MCINCATGGTTWRLPLRGGGHVFMEFHHYFGPFFYRDRKCTREIEDWWENPEICAALEWWQERGKVA